jgi:hypothetical protein
MDCPLDSATEAAADAEVVAFLSQLDPTEALSIWVWDWQHMDDAAFVRAQKVAEWLALQDPRHKIDDLLAQAKALYGQANDLLAAVIPLLEAKPR